MTFKWLKASIGVGIALVSTMQIAQAGNPISGDDWLHVEGNKVVDMQGNPVWMTGANWFGFNAGERVFHGIWSVNLEDTMQSIADHGINLLRVPISTELLLEWRDGNTDIAQVNTWTNPNLTDVTTLQVFDASIAAAKKVGIKILLDVHSAEADNSGHYAPLWYKGDFTPQDFYDGWAWVAERYANDDTIVAFDLENEPHGQPWSATEFAKWDNSTDDNNWKYACETAANIVLDKNPNILVMCEGIESYPKDTKDWTNGDSKTYYSSWWGGNLRPVRDFPVDLGDRQQQFMYSPHDYGPLVFKQPWFYEGFDKDTLYEDVWKDNWMFIHEEEIAPLLIGEWGGFMDGGDNEKWMVAIRELIIEHGLHHTFWCINPNSGDTGGLLMNDWVTWDAEKYALFKPSLWQNNAGQFIGLDHQVVLGKNGTNVAEFYGSSTSTPTNPLLNIVGPSANTMFAPGSAIEINYNLAMAAGANVYIDGNLHTTTQSYSKAVVTAPNEYNKIFTVKLVALDSQGQELSASDSVILKTHAEAMAAPSIDITSPSNAQSFQVNTEIIVTVSLTDAQGFNASLNSDTYQFNGNSGTVVAPKQAGEYELSVLATDRNGQSLSVSDAVTIFVTSEPSDNSDTDNSGTGSDNSDSENTDIGSGSNNSGTGSDNSDSENTDIGSGSNNSGSNNSDSGNTSTDKPNSIDTSSSNTHQTASSKVRSGSLPITSLFLVGALMGLRRKLVFKI